MNTNEDKRFTPPAQESWWLVKHSSTGLWVYSEAKTAYYAVANARYENGYSCGWVLSECEVKLVLEPHEVPEIMKMMD